LNTKFIILTRNARTIAVNINMIADLR